MDYAMRPGGKRAKANSVLERASDVGASRRGVPRTGSCRELDSQKGEAQKSEPEPDGGSERYSGPWVRRRLA
ncbi:hypothetical protein VTK73DRAFT_5693 [Phialemonium thermophilum]|uniref:Uncharacterized protein n=1 Tax=Phialemonium thermophilum TaxID=223376 RepID=A0ABR3V1B1_9PEZI